MRQDIAHGATHVPQPSESQECPPLLPCNSTSPARQECYSAAGSARGALAKNRSIQNVIIHTNMACVQNMIMRTTYGMLHSTCHDVPCYTARAMTCHATPHVLYHTARAMPSSLAHLPPPILRGDVVDVVHCEGTWAHWLHTHR